MVPSHLPMRTMMTFVPRRPLSGWGDRKGNVGAFATGAGGTCECWGNARTTIRERAIKGDPVNEEFIEEKGGITGTA